MQNEGRVPITLSICTQSAIDNKQFSIKHASFVFTLHKVDKKTQHN